MDREPRDQERVLLVADVRTVLALLAFAALVIGLAGLGLLPMLVTWAEVAQPLAPFITLAVGTVAGLIAWRSHLHRRMADSRAEFWRRTQYALDLIVSAEDSGRRNIGMSLVRSLQDNASTVPEDLNLLRAAVSTAMAAVLTGENSALVDRGEWSLSWQQQTTSRGEGHDDREAP